MMFCDRMFTEQRLIWDESKDGMKVCDSCGKDVITVTRQSSVSNRQARRPVTYDLSS